MRSTKHFKAQALAILANPTLSIADRARMLEMVRITCAMFMKAQREGVALDDRIVLERDPVMSPAEARRAAREAGEGRYRGQPCPTCGGTERFTCDARCATCKPGYFDHLEASHG